MIEKLHFVRVCEVNLDDRHGSVRSGVIDNRHAVIIVGALLRQPLEMESYFAAARKALQELHNLGERRFVSAFDFAIIYTGLGDSDQAFKWLQKARDECSYSTLMSLKGEPRFDALRSDPRFQHLVLRVGLPP